MSEWKEFACPECGRKAKINKEWVGRKVLCKCGYRVVVGASDSHSRSQNQLATTKDNNKSSNKNNSDSSWIDEATPDEEPVEYALFRRAIRRALGDGVVTQSEREVLENLRQEYRISSILAKQMFQEEKEDALMTSARSPIQRVDVAPIANLLQLASAASEAGNHVESMTFCNKALEIDPQNRQAWFGKGKASGWQSTLQNFRLREMCLAFQKAIELSPSYEVDAIVQSCAAEVVSVIDATYLLSSQNLHEFAAVDGVWESHLARCAEILDALQETYAQTSDIEIAIRIVNICGHLLSGVRYENFDGFTSAHHISDQYELALKKLRSEFGRKIQQADPTYQLSEVKKATSCFVITAAMGSVHHPAVVQLRQFRDVILASSELGRAFVKSYCRHGPKIAELVSVRREFQVAAMILIVCPCFAISTLILALCQCSRQDAHQE